MSISYDALAGELHQVQMDDDHVLSRRLLLVAELNLFISFARKETINATFTHFPRSPPHVPKSALFIA